MNEKNTKEMKDKERKLVVQEKVPIDVGRLPRAVE